MTERETEVDVTFYFFFCSHVVFQTNVAKDKQKFSPCFILCRVLLRDAVRCSVCVCAAQSNRKGY